MKYIDFYISYRCNNKCIFCTQADSIKNCENHPLTYKKIMSVLKKKRNEFTAINFTGGEPTLFSGFERLVKAAKKLGYRICVGTNGGRFADKKFCVKTAPFIDEVCFSCHGHTSRLHNLHTRNPESFERLRKAMDNLAIFPVFFSNNTVITKYNLPYLNGILALLSNKRIKQSLFSNLSPAGEGLENYQGLAAGLNGIKKNIPDLVRLAKQNKIILAFCDVPPCILGGYGSYSGDFSSEERISIKQSQNKETFFLKEEKPCFPNCRKMKTERCNLCFYEDICEGIFKKYYHLFGDKEIEAVKK